MSSIAFSDTSPSGTMTRDDLETLSDDDLVREARVLGISHANVLGRRALMHAIRERRVSSPEERTRYTSSGNSRLERGAARIEKVVAMAESLLDLARESSAGQVVAPVLERPSRLFGRVRDKLRGAIGASQLRLPGLGGFDLRSDRAAPAQNRDRQRPERTASVDAARTERAVAEVTGASNSPEVSAAPEPIRTRTMARLLAVQGHRDRAVRIYRELLGQDPSNTRVRNELAELLAVPGAPVGDGTDSVKAEVEPAGRIALSWTATDAGRARAESLLAATSSPTSPDLVPPLVLRRVTMTVAENGEVRSDVTDESAIPATGSRTYDADPTGTITFAIGLRSGERFVAIAHTAPVSAAANS